MLNEDGLQSGATTTFRHLRSELKRSRVVMLRNAVEPILSNNLLPHFTDHSVSHSDSLCALVDQLIEKLQDSPKGLTDTELAILYSACYLHDIGMQYEQAGATSVIRGINPSIEWIDLPEADRRELLRAHHHKISAELVAASVGAAHPPIGMQLTDDDRPSAIAALCEAHCVPPESDRYLQLMSKVPRVRMPLLSGLLRLADILDESRHRACQRKADTLLLNLESQSHWWRHYYTVDVEIHPQSKCITISYEFPSARADEYRNVIPQLQQPWIAEELKYHHSAFIQEDLGWELKLEIVSQPYSQVIEMPENVLAEMLQQLHGRRLKADVQSRQMVLQLFSESRPHIERRLASLRDRKSSLSSDDYIRDLAELSINLWDLGSHRSSWASLLWEFESLYATLDIELRIKVGSRLLEMLVEDNVPEMARSWVLQFEEDLSSLKRSSLTNKSDGLQGVARWYRQVCSYKIAVKAYENAIACTEDNAERQCLIMELLEMHYLQGEIDCITADVDNIKLIRSSGVNGTARGVLLLAKVNALSGSMEEAISLIDNCVASLEPDCTQSRIELWMTKAEILHLNFQDDDALEVFANDIAPLIPHVSDKTALVVGFNKVRVLSSVLRQNNFYELVDQGRVAGVELWNRKCLLEARESAAEGKHYESLPAIWRELLRTYQQGCWSPYCDAASQMAKQCLQLALPREAAFHAILSQADNTCSEVGGFLARFGTPEDLSHILALLMKYGSLHRPFVTACRAIVRLVDVIPDAMVNGVFVWLLERARLSPTSDGERAVVETAWDVLKEIAFRLDDSQAMCLAQTAGTHPSWTLLPAEPNRVIPIRRVMLQAIILATEKISKATASTIAIMVLPLATERKQHLDFQDAIECLCRLTKHGDDALIAHVRAALYPDGKPIGAMLLQVAHIFNQPTSNPTQLALYAEKVTDNLRLQVSLNAENEQAATPPGTLFTISASSGTGKRVVHMIPAVDLVAVVRHRGCLPKKTLSRVIDTALAMIREPENVIANKVGMTHALAPIGDCCSVASAKRIVQTLIPLARGEIVEPSCVMSAAEADNPLNPYKMRTGNPKELQGVAVYTIAAIARDKPGHFEKDVRKLLELAIIDTDSRVRSLALSAARLVPDMVTETAFATTMLATRDHDPAVVNAAFGTVAEFGARIQGDTLWHLLLQSFRLASRSDDVKVRRGAASAASKLLSAAPKANIRNAIKELNGEFRRDRCYSVRRLSI